MRRLILLVLLLSASLSAQTAISDTLYDPSGATVNGRVEIVPSAEFVTSGGAAVSRQKFIYTIENGVLSFNLQPTASATPSGVSYTATFYLEERSSYSETWTVPLSGPAALSDIRVSVVPTPTVTINLSQLVQGGATTGQVLEWDGSAWAPASAGGTITVREVDGSPSVGSVTTVEFAEASGFVVTDQTGGVARVSQTLTDAMVPNTITIDLASAATALAANGANCSAGLLAGGVDASGAAEDCADPLLETELDEISELQAQIADATLLTTADEGSGNGIDADTLDGSEGSAYLLSTALDTLGELETQIAGYNFSDAANLDTGTIPEARIGTFSSLVNLDGGFEVADIRCTASAGVMTCQDPTASTGVTTLSVQGGAGQGSTDIFQVKNTAGSDIARFNASNFFFSNTVHFATSTLASARVSIASGVGLGNSYQFYWKDGSSSAQSSNDTGLARDSAGVVKVTDGSTGDGALKIGGAVAYPPAATEPADCTAGAEGSSYYSTADDRQCYCADDDGDAHFEWVMSDDYSHASGHCSI